MKIFLIALVMLLHIVLALPSWAARTNFSPNSDAFAIGQRVTWHYQARSGSDEVRKISAEIIKLGVKRVQIKVRQNNGDYVNRWVNADKLEKHKK
ncbi:MAG: hypothetical protein MUD14_22320 [Hydrococcus sp. Prado102]|jgi:hypothetical protein|nr:hypothetical protein [Hydrococcus sp. Prado102]